MLKYYATNKDGTLFAQDVLNLMLEEEAAADNSTGQHDYIFPDNIASYKAGTVVLQPKDGKTTSVSLSRTAATACSGAVCDPV